MLRLRCPKCGTNLYRGYYKFPVCHQCGTNALSCRGCLSFDPKAGICTDVLSPIDTVQDADAMPDCGRFRPRLAVEDAGDRPLGRRFWLYVALAVVVVVFLATLGFRRLFGQPPPTEYPLHTLIGLPSDIYPGTPFDADLMVENADADLAHSFEVRIGPETMEDVQFQGATPKPQRETMRGQAKYLQYGIIPPGVQHRVVLRFMPTHGRARLRVRVLDDRGRLVGEERADVRITP